MTFLVNLMLRRFDKFYGLIFAYIFFLGGGLIFGILIGLHIFFWGGGGVLTGFYGILLRYRENVLFI